MFRTIDRYCQEFRDLGNNPRAALTLQHAIQVEHGISVNTQFSVSDNMWRAEAFPGNDLTYYGEAHSIGEAIALAVEQVERRN